MLVMRDIFELKIPAWWRNAVLPSLPWLVCFLSVSANSRQPRAQCRERELCARQSLLLVSLLLPYLRFIEDETGATKKKENTSPREGWEDGRNNTLLREPIEFFVPLTSLRRGVMGREESNATVFNLPSRSRAPLQR